MIRKRVPKLLTMLATAACIFGFVSVAPAVMPTLTPVMTPVATADVLPNGYDVNCTKVNDLQVLCTVAGCPRVNVADDLAGDELHVHINGDAANGKEVAKACGDTYSETINIDANKPFTYHVQGVRHHDTGSDDLTAYSVYQYTPPAPQTRKCNPDTDVAAEVPIDQQCVAKPKPPVKCEPAEDFVAAEVPAGQTCQKKPAQTNAITATFDTSDGTVFRTTVKNSSTLPATCDYQATAPAVLLIPAVDTRRTFDVGPSADSTQEFDGLKSGRKYSITISCKDSSGKQTESLGSVSQTVTW